MLMLVEANLILVVTQVMRTVVETAQVVVVEQELFLDPVVVAPGVEVAALIPI
jgi:hypothetical protein